MADLADYYREIYMRGLGGETPAIPVSIAELERAAIAAMEPQAANYVGAGAGSEDTIRANAEAFRRRRIVPRMLRDVATRDLSTTVLGTPMPAPLLLAPIGVQKVVHEEGELATARAAAGRRAPRSPAPPRTSRLEEIAAAGGADPRAGSSSTGPTTAPGRELRRPRRARRLRRDRRHRRHLHPRLEAARPAAGLAAVPQRDGRRQLLPGPGLPRRAGADRRRRTRAPPPATSSASRPTRR